MNSVTEKMLNLLGKWGPYSKKYSGISRIADHRSEDGVRFDCVVSPAIENADSRVPNVTVPTGVHPWEAKADYSFYSYRYDLEWKDRVYADVSFTKLGDDSVLIRTEFFNNTDITQICLLNMFSAIEYPSVYSCTPILPTKSVLIKALDYISYDYNTARPWDRQTMDAMKKGEFFDDRFTYHRGLGDRDDNRYILEKFSKLGREKGDKIVYEFENPYDFSNPVLHIRYRTTDGIDSVFSVNGENVIFPESDEMRIVTIPFHCENTITLLSLGGGGIEFDFLAVTEKDETVDVKTEKHNFYPEIEMSENLVSYKYYGLSDKFYLKTFNNTRYRDFNTGCLEDSPTARISQPDESFHNMLEPFSGSFSEKHSDEGFYHNVVVHTLYVKPHTSHVEYAVLSFGKTNYKTTEEYEKIYQSAYNSLDKSELNDAGKKYEFSNKILKATVFQNTVYPLYRHGEYIVHHTPGKRWDSFYTWDSGFIGLFMLEFAPDIADYILDTYLSDTDNPDYAFLLHGSPVPTHIYQYFEMLKKSNNKNELLKYYSQVKLYYLFLAGKINGSTTDKFKSGLLTTFDYFYNCSGMDDLPPQKAMYERNLQKYTASVISSSQVIRCAKMLYIVADLLHLEEDKAEYIENINRITNALQKYSWDEKTGYFSYVLHNENGDPTEMLKTADGENLNKTTDGIYPLIAGAVTNEQKQIILSHLKNEMFTSVGISAVDTTASYFINNGYWNGNVWFPHQWFIWKTMLDIGENDFAFKIAETALDSWKREVEYSYYTFEMLNIKSGRGGWFHNFGGLSTPICIWTNAYFKPKTFTTGFDVMVIESGFSDDATAFSCKLRYYGKGEKYSAIAVMNDKYDYNVIVNGEKADFNIRSAGVIEITLNEKIKECEIIISSCNPQ